jgi:hypothetical protein
LVLGQVTGIHLRTFNYDNGAAYIIPDNSPQQNQLSDAQINALDHLGLYPLSHQVILNPLQLSLVIAAKYLDFFRNRYSHRMYYLYNWLLVRGRVAYTPTGSELVQRIRNPLALPNTQLQLFRLGCHPGHLIRRFF